jgi:hypothetical protein
MVGVPVWTRRTARQRSPDVEAGRIIPRSVDCYNAIKSSDTSPNVLITLALLRSPEQDHLSRPRWRALRQFCVCSQYLRGDRRRVVPGNPGSCDYRDRAGTSRPPRSCSAGRALMWLYRVSGGPHFSLSLAGRRCRHRTLPGRNLQCLPQGGHQSWRFLPGPAGAVATARPRTEHADVSL